MTSISKAKRDELVLLNSPRKDVLRAGFLTSLIVTSPLAVLLALSYGGADTLAYLLAFLASIFILSLAAGFIIPQERRLITTYRLSSGIPIFSTTSFIVWAGASFLLYLGNPDFLGFRKFLTTFFVLPLLLILLISILYSVATRRIFLELLYRSSRLDYVTLYYKNTIFDRLLPMWDANQRHGGHLSLLLIQIDFSASSEAAEMELLDKLANICREKLRCSDEAGIFSRDELWILFPQTSAEEAIIPGRRIQDILNNTPSLESSRNVNGFRLRGSYIVESNRSMEEPEDFVAAAVAALEQGPKEETHSDTTG